MQQIFLNVCGVNIFLKILQRSISTRILGIETSCDDTGVAIIDNSGNVLCEKLASQTQLSVKFGGVLPTIAAQLHKENLNSLVQSAFHECQISPTELDCIAVTTKPGLALSLNVGLKYAKSMSKEFLIPIIPIHHMEAHALTAMLTNPSLEYPYMVLLLSGGHCLLGIVNNVDEFMLLGTALDSSPGDILDKIARRLKIPRLGDSRLKDLSGGQSIEFMAKYFGGDPKRFEFPLTRSQSRDCDFSFSGLHVAVERKIKVLETEFKERNHGEQFILPVDCIASVCSSVQLAMTKLICRRVQRALEFVNSNVQYPDTNKRLPISLSNRLKALVVSGGVASNDVIRSNLSEVAHAYGLEFVAPPARLCTDNGVMIAWNGLLLHRAGLRITKDIDSLDFETKVPFGVDYRNLVAEADLHIDPIKLSMFA